MCIKIFTCTTTVLAIILYFLLILAVKNEITGRNRKIIMGAIYAHNIKVGHEKRIDYDVMEDYNRTLYRLWDWGYTRIVPPEVFEEIKTYIER